MNQTMLARVGLCFVGCLAAYDVDAAYPRPARSKGGMVASAHSRATDIGVEILEKGGNAVDAAVATTFAISVTLPYSAGIGGGGFLVFYDALSKKVRSLDFRERAPKRATRDMYLDENGSVIKGASTDGYRSVAVPGTVAGLFEIHQKFGKLPWRDVVAPSIVLARDGFAVSELYAGFVEWRRDVLERFPATRAIFFRSDGKPFESGELLRQPDLAKTLARIAADPSDFYRGEIAKRIAFDMKKNGGLIDHDDLKNYSPTWRKPICADYRGHRVCSMPPPSSGGVHLTQMLRMNANDPLAKERRHDVDELHVLIESMRSAYADRSLHLGDPDVVDVPVEQLLDETYLRERRRAIDGKRARRSTEVAPMTRRDVLHESNDTSHLVVVDRDHNAVSLTFTVNYGFGSGVVVPGTGILLNDEMDDFSAAPGSPNAYGLLGGEANAIGPRKIPLSSMTPTIVLKDKDFFAGLGSPGGSTIITTVLQVTKRIVDDKFDPQAAVAAPRLHHQWQPDVVWIEKNGFDSSTFDELKSRGFAVEWREGWGNAQAVSFDGTWFLGGADPRGEGTAKGPASD